MEPTLNLYDNIPTELVELDQWCVFKKAWMPERQKFTKVPFNPLTGQPAKSNDPQTWVSFDDAESHAPNWDGIGFFFHEGYYGVDLDNVESAVIRYQNGEFDDNIVADFIDTLTSYAEISPSGTGVHIICRGELPPGGRRKGDIEMYDHGRFFTMTGKRIGPYLGVFDDAGIGKINFLHHKYIGENDIKVTDLSAVRIDGNDLEIEDIIDAALDSANGLRFQAFMSGQWKQFYPSQSEADMSFANDLAFWCARDFDKMDAIFRRSGMMRDKWDAKRENSTYGQITLTKAINECNDVYQPVSDFTLNISEEALKGGSKKPKVNQKAFTYDDMGNSGRFLYAFRENVLYSYTNKIWYYFNGKYWTIDELGKLHEMADFVAENVRKEPIYVADKDDEKLVKQAKKSLLQHAKYTRSFRGKENMLKDVQHHVAVKPSQFDANPTLFNTHSGYIDLNNAHLMSHETSKEKYFTRISYTSFTPEAECPLWLKFLDEIFLGDAELIDYIQRAIGYSLSADTSEQVMFILLGNGQNGKSVLLNTLSEVFGTYAMNIQPSTIAVKSGGSAANSDVARLQGARFVSTTEPNRGMQLDEGVVKQITGGDTVTARFLYGKEFEFRPEFKVWMATNYKPIISGTDEGIWRRIVVIPFEYQVPAEKKDKKLEFKLKNECPGILNWCIEGYKKWKERGLDDEPSIIKANRHDYRSEMDTIQRFVEEECFTEDTTIETKGVELWQAFQSWIKKSNEYSGFTAKRFHMEMAKKFKKRKTMNGVVYVGIRLDDEAGKELRTKHMFDNVVEFG